MTDQAKSDVATESSAPAAQTPQEKSGVFDDLVDVLTSPREVFARASKKGFGVAFFAIWLLMSTIGFGSKSIYEPALDAQMAQANAKVAAAHPELTPDQIASASKFGAAFATVGVLISPPIMMLFLGLLVWAVGRVFGAQLTTGQGMLIATYSYVPRALGALAVLGLSFVTDMSHATNMAQFTLSPARFLNPATTGATMMALLARADVTVLWGTALIAIAYAAIGKLKTGTAWGGAIALWLLGSLPLLYAAMSAG